MPVPTTADGFLDLVRKSNLVDPARLQAYLALFKADDVVPIDPPRLAARFVKDGILTNFQAQQLLRGRHRNFTIVGKYKILEPLGAGGMSKVFLVEHIAMGHRVAMKILPIEGTKDDPALIARFKREAKAIAAVNHPNVIRAHDIDSEGARFHYIIMDYVEGVNLHDLVRKRGPLDPAAAAHYIHQTAIGLQHLHDAGLIHRDIKPGNLLVDRHGVVKILDLGLARFETEGGSLTQKFDDNAILGTADYLAPEQALRSSSLDSRADIYGLGATFYFLLAGQAPFESEKNVTQKLLSHQMKQPMPLGKIRDDIPPAIVATVERMMAKDPEGRYSSAADVAAALTPWADVDVPPPTDDELPRRSPASQSQWGSPSRGSKPPSTARRSATAAMDETPPMPSKVASTGRPPTFDWVKPAAEPQAQTGWIIGIVAGISAFVALGIGLWFWAPWEAIPERSPTLETPSKSMESRDEVAPTPSATQSAASDVPLDALIVSAESKPGAFRTLAGAVAAAKDGATIIVRTPLAEQLVLGPKTPKNLTLRAASTDANTWNAPASADPAKPLLRADDCEGLTVSGFHFDGQNVLDTLVEIGGSTPGLTLDELTLTGGRRILLRFSGSGGATGRLARVTGCRLTAPSEIRAAIAFESPQPAAFVEIDQSRVEGRFQSGILFAGPTDGIAVQHTRFFAVAHGLRYEPIRSKAPLRATVVGNTFCRTTQAMSFRELPPANASHLAAQNNLFLDVQRVASVDDFSLQPADLGGHWIWVADDMKSDSPVVPAKQPRYFRKTLEISRVPLGPVTLDISCDENFTAFVNGDKVSGAVPEYYNQRVYSYDVTKSLRLGKNVLAVRAENRNDRLNANVGTPAGLFANLTDRSDSEPRLMASSDETWKASKSDSDGWDKAEYDDAKWPKAKAWGNLATAWPWSRVTWDAEVNRQLASTNSSPLPLTLGGNVRNFASWEAYPILDATRVFVDDPRWPSISRDPTNAQFLLFAPSHGLMRAGMDGKPAGVPGK